mmetsp:Transcript_4660/g.13475  ORF Transcript_4660/g.13475 Transcript_4660/m.13475 type:complete len:283 (-) Transcript_4660:287-1135(-)
MCTPRSFSWTRSQIRPSWYRVRQISRVRRWSRTTRICSSCEATQPSPMPTSRSSSGSSSTCASETSSMPRRQDRKERMARASSACAATSRLHAFATRTGPTMDAAFALVRSPGGSNAASSSGSTTKTARRRESRACGRRDASAPPCCSAAWNGVCLPTWIVWRAAQPRRRRKWASPMTRLWSSSLRRWPPSALWTRGLFRAAPAVVPPQAALRWTPHCRRRRSHRGRCALRLCLCPQTASRWPSRLLPICSMWTPPVLAGCSDTTRPGKRSPRSSPRYQSSP